MSKNIECEKCSIKEQCKIIQKKKFTGDETKLIEEIIDKATKWGEDTKRIKGKSDTSQSLTSSSNVSIVSSSSSVDSYKSYLRNFEKWFECAKKNCGKKEKSNEDIKKISNIKRLPFDYRKVLIYLSLLEKTGDRLYSITVSNMMLEFVQEARDVFCKIDDTPKNAKENLKKCCSGYALLNDYLLFNRYDTKENISNNDYLNKIYENINKKDLYHQLDGMTDLLVEVGEKNFFEMAIGGSYFFDIDMVNQQNEKELLTPPTKARKTTDQTIKQGRNNDYTIKSKKGKVIPCWNYCFEPDITFVVQEDPNNNKFVCDLINKYTKLNLGSGKNNIIQNTIISHVWGRAYDPRYFRSLWNIVLIPAWANSLMDKEKCEEHTLASKMRATVMEICKRRYPEKTENEDVVNDSDIQKGEYLINVIKEYDEKTGAIRIVKEKIAL